MIIDTPSLSTVDIGEESIITHLSNKRDLIESANLIKDRFCKVPNMMLQDELFDQYIDLIRNDIDSPTGIKLVVGYKNPNCPKAKDKACVYIQNGSVYLKASTYNGVQESSEITNDLKKVDERIYRHIISILSKPENPTNLSKRDSELIHFLIAKRLYS